MSEDYDEEPREEAKFNMGLDCLKRVSMELRQISYITLNVEDSTRAAHMKYQKIKDLFTAAYPLFKDKKKRLDIGKKIIALKLLFKIAVNQASRKDEKYCEPRTDEKLDAIIHEIEDALQEEGYFMPSRDESDMF